MTKWEYCAIRASVNGEVMKLKYFSPTPEAKVVDINDVHQSIARLGQEGWEMVSLTQISQPDARVYYFKRPAA
jgi:hypothetical protein